jgi:DNA (cytosine-5)-methyltransferase 1
VSGAYYNELDPFCAAWLRNLIDAGLIAKGEVDERDIRTVSADELVGFTQCHFFAGIGGWSYALRLAGWDDERPVWTGSCPCQPFSTAGRGEGLDDARHLWPAWCALIRERRPVTVFGEQVAQAARGSWLDLVSADLEALGYAVGATILPACGVGAPHVRSRLWFVGHAESERQRRRDLGTGEHGTGSPHTGELGDAASARREGAEVAGGDCAATGSRRRRGEPERASASGCMADTDMRERGRLADGEGCVADREAPGRQQGDGEPQRSGASRVVADASIERREGVDALLRAGRPDEAGAQAAGSGAAGELAHPNRERDANGEPRAARSAPGSLQGIDGEREWVWSDPWQRHDVVDCRDGYARLVEPGTFPLAARLPGDVGRLRAYGNAIVPQVGAAFVAAFMECRP